MPNLEFTYSAQRFRPREGHAQELLLFVAPAVDIRAWAGVPRKAFDYQHGFQRTLNPARVVDVTKYFREDAKNVSPTSIVVGLTADVAIDGPPPGGAAPTHVTVRISLPDYASMSIEELAGHAIDRLRTRIPEATATQVEQNVAEAFSEALRLQDEEAVDEAFGIEAGTDIDSGLGVDPGGEERSYLSDFYAQLLGYQQRLLPWPNEGQLREILYSILRPAIIVDGQHRVFGGAQADPGMLFAVCAIPNSSWAESVYQFVVINQKAKPIKPAFLSSIIATSLKRRGNRVSLRPPPGF